MDHQAISISPTLPDHPCVPISASASYLYPPATTVTSLREIRVRPLFRNH